MPTRLTLALLALANLAALGLAASTRAEVNQLREENEALTRAVAAVKSSRKEDAAKRARMEDRIASLEQAGSRVVKGEDGELYLDLSEERVIQCVYGHMDGVRTAETSFDAAFDEFSSDLAKIGFAIEPGGSCDRHLALRVRTDGRTGYDVDAVVTRGTALGRRFTTNREGDAREVTRVPDEELAALLAEPGWIGGR